MAAKKKASKKPAKEQEFEADVEEPSTALTAPSNLPAGIVAAEGDDDDWSEEYASDRARLQEKDLIIPMIKIVQELSEIYKNRSDENPVKLGNIYNSTSLQQYDAEQGLLLVPIADYTECVVERLPAPKGDFVARHDVNDPMVQEAYNENCKRERNGWVKLTNPNNRNQLIYTEEVLCVLIDPADGVTPLEPVLVPFSGTNVFPRKMWWNAMTKSRGGTKAPWYSNRSLLRTELRQGDGADSFRYRVDAYGGDWCLGRLRERVPEHKAFMDRCKQFVQLYHSGDLGRPDYQAQDANTSGASETAAEDADF